ncbi:MAG: GDSL-type esterase/lipase family protein [Bacteroidota bacterium]|nr:GDSL-type esterase/lipase family protein [Bacteroidota bacterium]
MIRIFSVFFVLSCCIYSCKKDSDAEGYESYRYELWKKCVQNNFQIDFIGQQFDDGTYPNFMGVSFDRDHEGIGGIESEGVLNNIEEVLLQTNVLDAVLLCVGGNDLLGGDDPQTVIDNIALIIDEIQNRFPNIIIFLEQIAPGNNETMTNDLSLKLSEFNDLIYQTATAYSNQNTSVIAVDMNTNFTVNLLADDVHYNQDGAVFVAEQYFSSISTVFTSQDSLKILPLGDSRVEGARP